MSTSSRELLQPHQVTVLRSSDITQVTNWDTQLPALMRQGWTNAAGEWHYPFPHMADPNYWRDQVKDQWADGSFYSWVAVDKKDRIVVHSGMLHRPDVSAAVGKPCFEIGRLVRTEDAPKGLVREFTAEAATVAEQRGYGAHIEGTGSHPKSQWMLDRMGFRFGGFLIYPPNDHLLSPFPLVILDNHKAAPHDPRPGVVGDLHGIELPFRPEYEQILADMAGNFTEDRTIELPFNRRFHTLGKFIPSLEGIIAANLSQVGAQSVSA